MSNPVNIVIVGGGTAGWMAANLLAKKWVNKAKITLIESPNIPIVGVGEGSTPYLKKLFQTLEIDEQVWMSKCNATYKNGIMFSHWSSIPGFQQYFHPFHSDLDVENLFLFEKSTIERRAGENVCAHPDYFFLVSELTRQARVSKAPDNANFENLYGYHFDSHLLGAFLKENAKLLGVNCISANVVDIAKDKSEAISQLSLDTGQIITGDLFIDCTGFKALLIEKTLKVPFHSYKDVLLNDSAIAIASDKNRIEMPQTISTAFSNGWAWRIPLTNRIGNGYVYSSSHQSPDSAEQELRAKLGNKVHNMEAKHLKMRIGRIERHWFKNCLAVGLSQGFIEPLEATALHLVQNTIEQFIQYFEKGGFTTQYQDYYNQQTNFGFDRIRDYVLLHYLTNSRNDSEYWKDVRCINNLSESLKRIIETWLAGKDLRVELEQQNIANYYSSMSWHTMLAGTGLYPYNERIQGLPKNIKQLEQLNSINKNKISLFQGVM